MNMEEKNDSMVEDDKAEFFFFPGVSIASAKEQYDNAEWIYLA